MTKISNSPSPDLIFFSSSKCTKTVFGRGSTPDPTGGAYDAPPDLLVGWGGGYPLHISLPSTPSASWTRRLRHLGPQTPSTQIPGYASGVKITTWYAITILYFDATDYHHHIIIQYSPPLMQVMKSQQQSECVSVGDSMKAIADSYKCSGSITQWATDTIYQTQTKTTPY